jgi:hypothetical protein
MNKITDKQLGDAERQFKRFEAMICSMTPAERGNPDLLAKARLCRVRARVGPQLCLPAAAAQARGAPQPRPAAKAQRRGPRLTECCQGSAAGEVVTPAVAWSTGARAPYRSCALPLGLRASRPGKSASEQQLCGFEQAAASAVLPTCLL